ncbi:MAG: YitT family protein [Clostridium sp.]|nr:YitT family protein [Clostridium sp.]
MGEKKIVSDLYKKRLERLEKNKKWRDGAAVVCIMLGSLIVAVNMNTFVEQGKLVPGGFSGLAKLIQRVGLTFYDVRISFTLLNILFNAVPAVFAYRLVGKKFTVLSCLSLLTVSVLVDELPVIPITGDILLISVFGGILNGLGMSLILNNNASSGGTDFIAMSLSVKYKVSTFNYMLLFSAVIILTSGVIFGMDKALYSIIFQFCNTQVINTFYKKYKKKTLLIVTDNPAAVSADLLELTNHSSTILKGFGSYSAHKKYLIYTVLSDSDVRKMKKRIHEAYPDTFVNVINSSDVVGNFYIRPFE